MNQIAALRNSDFELPIPDRRMTNAAKFVAARHEASRLPEKARR